MGRVRTVKKRRRFSPTSVGLIFGGIVAVVILVLSQTAKPSVDLELSSASAGLKPDVQKTSAPALIDTSSFPSSAETKDDLFLQRLTFLFQFHPDPEVQQFGRLLVSHRVILSITHEPTHLASFQVISPDQLPEGDPHERSDPIPALLVNWEWIANMKKEDVPAAMLMISHEHVHYKQWLSGSKKDRTLFFLAAKLLSTDLLRQLGLTFADMCEFSWRTEKEAYAVTCQEARRWSVSHPFWLCDHFGTSQWDQALFKYQYDGKNEICTYHAAVIAGHPDPKSLLPRAH